MNQELSCEIMGINRMRMGTDGKGISTLVTCYGCDLSCKYCLNPQCKRKETKRINVTPQQLLDILFVDDIYFQSTGGGVVFGGGEPLLQVEYIAQVCEIIPREWQIRIETCLNVPWDRVKILTPYINEWIIDLKDGNPNIYKDYTGIDGFLVYENIRRLADHVGKEKLMIRVPEIPDYNTKEQVLESRKFYSSYGRVDAFRYRKRV